MLQSLTRVLRYKRNEKKEKNPKTRHETPFLKSTFVESCLDRGTLILNKINYQLPTYNTRLPTRDFVPPSTSITQNPHPPRSNYHRLLLPQRLLPTTIILRPLLPPKRTKPISILRPNPIIKSSPINRKRLVPNLRVKRTHLPDLKRNPPSPRAISLGQDI